MFCILCMAQRHAVMGKDRVQHSPDFAPGAPALAQSGRRACLFQPTSTKEVPLCEWNKSTYMLTKCKAFFEDSWGFVKIGLWPVQNGGWGTAVGITICQKKFSMKAEDRWKKHQSCAPAWLPPSFLQESWGSFAETQGLAVWKLL